MFDFSMYDALFKICAYFFKCTKKLPRHIAIIPDNNRTFSKKAKITLPSVYFKGQDKVLEYLRWSSYLKITSVTVFLFSVHNMSRSEEERRSIFQAFQALLKSILKDSMNFRVQIIGDEYLLPEEIKKLCETVKHYTQNNNGLLVYFALNYSSKNEMTDVALKIVNTVRTMKLSSDITQTIIENLLYTTECPEIDLLIRSSKHRRLSDFLLWQTSYSCLYFCNLCWPEMTKWKLLQAIFYYQRTK